MASDHEGSIQYLEERLCELFPKAREWVDAGKSQKARNDDAQEAWGQRPPPCAYEILILTLYKFEPAAIVKGAVKLVQGAPSGFNGTNFARLVLDFVEPEQRKIESELRAQASIGQLPIRWGTAGLDGGSKIHPSIRRAIENRTAKIGRTGFSETHKLARSPTYGPPFKCWCGKDFDVLDAWRRHSGQTPPPGLPCICGERFEERDDLLDHMVIHYPPGARAYWTRERGLDPEAVEAAAAEIERTGESP